MTLITLYNDFNDQISFAARKIKSEHTFCSISPKFPVSRVGFGPLKPSLVNNSCLYLRSLY